MLLDKKSQVHLYQQVAMSIRQKIASGEYPVGGALPTEVDLCRMYGVSRYPMRQAMSILVQEGYLVRSRGKGTFVSDPGLRSTGEAKSPKRSRSIALILPGLEDDFALDILKGFERTASMNGYATFLGVSNSPESEMGCIGRVVNSGVSGIVLFPIDGTLVTEDMLNELIGGGVYISIIDRNPGLDHIDYVGSDNSGGGYLAARHMRLQGFESGVFVSDLVHISSVLERLNGFKRGLKQYGLKLLNEELRAGDAADADYSFARFKEMLPQYREHLPFAVLGENFFTAHKAMAALQESGFAVGESAGIIGFDNLPQCKYLSPPMTTIAQNGMLIGETAAALAIQKIESGSKQSVRHILPTQLIARKSCGEDRTQL